MKLLHCTDSFLKMYFNTRSLVVQERTNIIFTRYYNNTLLLNVLLTMEISEVLMTTLHKNVYKDAPFSWQQLFFALPIHTKQALQLLY
jgi:hypothetical protein